MSEYTIDPRKDSQYPEWYDKLIMAVAFVWFCFFMYQVGYSIVGIIKRWL